MTYTLVIRPEAEADLAEAYEWHEDQREGLGDEYLLCVEAVLDFICRHPFANAIVHRQIRRALVRRFPYGVFYFVEEKRIVVTAVFHCHRDPSGWKRRS